MSKDSSNATHEADMLDPDEAAEEIPSDGDAAMDSDGEEEEIDLNQARQIDEELEVQLQNDSIAYFDAHNGNSIFCISQHPVHPNIIATGGGDDEEGRDVGVAFIFDCQSTLNNKIQTSVQEKRITPILEVVGHTDSVSAITFTQPFGEFLVTGGLDGRLIVNQDVSNGAGNAWKQAAVAQEVDEINWLSACPSNSSSSAQYSNAVALGASDGSVWVYSISSETPDQSLSIMQTYYIHTASCTAGSWTPDGNLLVTVSEDGSLYAWDVWGKGAAAGLASTSASGSGQALVGLTAQDERFRVDGGLFSVSVAPNGAFVAAGGADGNIRVIGLPRLSDDLTTTQSSTLGIKSGAGAKSKVAGAKQAASTKAINAAGSGQGQAGALLASLKAQDGSVETLDFVLATGVGGPASGSMLLASGSVDGSIVVFDATKNFAVRRNIPPVRSDATSSDGDVDGEGEAIVKVEFVRGAGDGWLLTSAGYDGILRRWDLRGGNIQGLVGEWKGHRGGGDGGGIMGFVQGLDNGSKVVTAGDDGVSLIFDMATPARTG